MRVIFKKNNPSESDYQLSKFNFEKFLKENSDQIISIEIPEDEIAQELIDFAQKTSIKILNKNIFRFTVKNCSGTDCSFTIDENSL